MKYYVDLGLNGLLRVKLLWHNFCSHTLVKLLKNKPYVSFSSKAKQDCENIKTGANLTVLPNPWVWLSLGWICVKEQNVSFYGVKRSGCSDSVDDSLLTVGIPELVVLLHNPSPSLTIWTCVTVLNQTKGPKDHIMKVHSFTTCTAQIYIEYTVYYLWPLWMYSTWIAYHRMFWMWIATNF